MPESGVTNPSHISTVVVLPAPFGPSNASTSAGGRRGRGWILPWSPRRALTLRAAAPVSGHDETVSAHGETVSAHGETGSRKSRGLSVSPGGRVACRWSLCRRQGGQVGVLAAEVLAVGGLAVGVWPL